ncbi:uncharacterized protein LOC111213371 [Brassica napus]|uniref:uncharacterized protein LOC111213371 n=1 Tax=Brassica napus TaxID=3708 RepID=UPI00207AC89B|nr:uncharacterized protein LOC111213371 [Brassica napus]
MANSTSFVNLLASQGVIDLDSSEPLCVSSQRVASQCSDESTVKERRKWSPKEDIIIIGAWLNTSKDPIVSNEQKGLAFWKRIVENYNSSPLLRIRQNDNDVMKAALDTFFNDKGFKFNLEHAWRELRHDVKWCSTYLEKDSGKDKRKTGDSDAQESLTEPQERPIGVKASKAAGISPLQKCTAALRRLAYGCAADVVDEYLRLGESTALSCLSNFTEGVIQLFGDEYLRRLTPEDLQRLLDIGEMRGFPGMIGSIDCRAPRVQYVVNGHPYDLAYYLTDSIYPKWSTFIQSISNPQGPEAELFAKVQESTRKDVERAFGVLQARFAIVKNPAILWDKRQIGMVMRTCIILHNMIVENERNGYTQYDTSEFEEGDSRSSQVDMSYSPRSSNLRTMLDIRRRVRDLHIHAQLKYDLIQNI